MFLSKITIRKLEASLASKLMSSDCTAQNCISYKSLLINSFTQIFLAVQIYFLNTYTGKLYFEHKAMFL
jgi:hypothetical protein